ncbi:MAG: hypothetical protein RBU37_22520 [Myxococcota bacterium]|jgi:hypothetical protein|nr:hypothetical protein [Myxococcota bacterium]
MPRQLLFVLFSNDSCKRNHAFAWALELHRAGQHVRLLLEGEGVQCMREQTGVFAERFAEALSAGLLVGACKTASCGCSTPERDVTAVAESLGVPLLDSLEGHAGVADFVAAGYELVIF